MSDDDRPRRTDRWRIDQLLDAYTNEMHLRELCEQLVDNLEARERHLLQVVARLEGHNDTLHARTRHLGEQP